MSVLLWREEYGDGGRGNRVSLSVVIEKIFNAPDASNLQVFNNDLSIGFIRWEIALQPFQRLKVPLSYTMDRKKSAIVT